MTVSEPSWRAVAEILAGRLENYDFCNNGHSSIQAGLAEGCPFCADRDAMRVFRAKCPPPAPQARGQSVPFYAVPEKQGEG